MRDKAQSEAKLCGESLAESKRGTISSMRLDGLRVLLVEDSSDNQLLFQRILVWAGAEVDIAENGAVGVKMQYENRYDVILMDIRMPVLDGYQATRRIRSQGFQGSIIALTAHATPGEQERCFAAGCSHFRLKPIDRHGLVGVVCEATTDVGAL